MEFPGLLDRFLTYVKIDTRSDEDSGTFPSTVTQLDFARRLRQELSEMGLSDATVNDHGYVFATLKSNQIEQPPVVALIAHLDTSPDVSGDGVNPLVHRDYDGRDILLSRDTAAILRVDENPDLKEKIGNTIITSDGTTLLGADDKAGIVEIMSAIRYLTDHSELPRPDIRILFTPDEELGYGTEKLTADEIAADIGYTVDGGTVGEIEDETFCADMVNIRVCGINAHPGRAKGKMVNAIKIASEILERFPMDSLSPETTEGREGYIHPHFMSGTVEEANITVLIRDFKEQGLKDKEAFILSVVVEARGRHPRATIFFDIEESYRNMKVVLDKHPEVIEMAEEAIRLSGLVPERRSIRGGTDGARLCFMGLPTPNLFTGGYNFHSRYEWITLEDMEKATEVIIRLMGLWAGKDPRKIAGVELRP
jgi:tripeptide aminopeptidase